MENNNQSIILPINEIIKILEIFFNQNPSNINYYLYQEIKDKFKDNLILKIIENFKLTVAVKSTYKETDILEAKHIIDIKQKSIALIFLKCLNSKFIDKSKKLNIEIIKYDEKYFELEKYLNVLTVLIDYSTSENSKSLDISSIDNIISIHPKELVKGVKKSLTSTLTGKKDDNYFRVHPSAKDEIVESLKLKNYTDLKNKHCYISCPCCAKKIKIDKKNLLQIITIKNNSVKILCHHEGTEYQKKLPFSFNNISIEKCGKTLEEKAMYILNNLIMLVKKEEKFDI